ncbi:MAG: methyltransferase domain-containing protein [Burkholderiales bacterium]|nr:methyltransferase domain-containing protein [Burkholderiales bacterium]
MDKHRVEQSFDDAASAYDRHAVIQRVAARHLADRIQTRWPHLNRIVEIGCGTGNLTQWLAPAYPVADYLATDLAPGMLEACARRMGSRLRYAQVDGEQAECTGHDLVASSLAFQWFDDPVGAIRRLHAQHVRLGIATLVEGTFVEWKAAHARLGLDDGVLPFSSEADFQKLAQDLGATVDFETIQEPYPQAMDFVRAIKAIGAGTPRPGHRPAPLGKVLRQFPEGITVSYRVAYLLAPVS